MAKLTTLDAVRMNRADADATHIHQLSWLAPLSIATLSNNFLEPTQDRMMEPI